MPGEHEHTHDHDQDIQIDPGGVIQSLQRQLNDRTLEIAKLESYYVGQINGLTEQLKEARAVISEMIPKEARTKVTHEGRTTKSSKSKKTKKKEKS